MLRVEAVTIPVGFARQKILNNEMQLSVIALWTC